MTLRLRLTLVATAVVAVVLGGASLTVYYVMRHELYRQVDSQLIQHAAQLQEQPNAGFRGFDPESADYFAIIAPSGKVVAGATVLPIDASMKAMAAGHETGTYLRSTTIQGYHVHEVVAPLLPPFSGAVVVARIVDSVDHDLHRLRLILILVTLGGIVAAAAGGALVSRTTLAPVRRLTDATERIARTRDPSERVPEGGRDEIARLGASFNTMLAALEDAIETQRRFVADASHELRTPLTSMQTNLDVLRRPAGSVQLDPDSRERLLEDLQREAHEMRDLIGGLLELARGDDPRLARESVRFDELVE
jgi:two-component system, OmpR family, sensor histidine kinase MprB